MSRDEIDTLLELSEVIEANLTRKPVDIALDRRVPHAALVATQVKYLQRAKAKIPSFYAVRCIIPPLAFEQASSEQTALHKTQTGNLAVDLTCGLGVDTWALAQKFRRVIAVERDADKAYLASKNFKLLGLENVTVVCANAEEFEIPAEADIIYIDADRRGAHGEKRVLLEDCSPNVLELLPRLKDHTTLLKLSPMFDVDEALRLLGGRVEVVSSGGEVKEVLVERPAPPITRHSEEPAGRRGVSFHDFVAATILGFGTVSAEPAVAINMPEALNWLVVPDAALVKARLAKNYFNHSGLYIESDTGFAFSKDEPRDLPGRVFRIIKTEIYSPRRLKKCRAEIMVRNFPHTASQLAGMLNIKEGGEQKLAFTRLDNKNIVIFMA